VEDATEMVYWPQFQHKTGQVQGHAGIFDDAGSVGSAVTPVLWVVATAGEVCNQVQDGTILP
jgi:hypothetical protein